MDNESKRQTQWAEPLPDSCPPVEAKSPNGEQYFRLVSTFPPAQDDFLSQTALNPIKKYFVGECRARSTSLFASYEECFSITKLPTHSEKNEIVVSIMLPTHCGVIMPTPTLVHPSHVSWWRSYGFDPIACCQEASKLITKGDNQ
jgi:hypothetical protein